MGGDALSGNGKSPLPRPLTGGPWEREIRTIETQITRYLRGEIADEKFRAFRLVHGIYGQRQQDVQMMRIKIPNGVLNSRQLEALADIAERYSHGLAHITTRQDIQFHFVKLEDSPKVLRHLAPSGLMSREACGNSVRNVTSCPHSGVHREEPFPVSPYAQAVARFLMRHPAAQLLGRKFKISLSGCPEDCAAGAIHDLGALARLRAGENGLERGFHVLVGGGLGSTPYMAQTLTDFHPAEDLLRLAETLVRIFSLHGNRKNRAKARSKFVVAKLGIERFRELFREHYEKVASSNRDDLEIETYLEPEEIARLKEEWPAPAERPLPIDPPPLGNGRQAEYELWLRRNTTPQRQPDLRAVTVSPRLGDIAPAPLRELARIVREHTNDEVRTTIQQTFLIRNVPVSKLPTLFEELRAAELAEPIAGTALDVLACPGADTCNLGITSSKGLARAISNELSSNGFTTDQLAGIPIKISGCPNSCGQHHIAAIGLHGIARNQNGRQAPFYQLHLGGRISSLGRNRIAKGSLKVPAKNAPTVVRLILENYFRERIEGEDLPDFLARSGVDEVKSWLGTLVEAPPPDEAPRYYTDFGQDDPFSTAAIGQGECAGAGVDLSADPFHEVVVGLRETNIFLEQGQTWDVLAELNRAVVAAGRILLTRVTGKEPQTDWETICEFRARFVDRGHTSELWDELRDEIDHLMSRKRVPLTPLPRLIRKTEALLLESRNLDAALQEWKKDPNAQPLPGVLPHGGGEAIG